MGRSIRQPRTARASGLDTRRRVTGTPPLLGLEYLASGTRRQPFKRGTAGRPRSGPAGRGRLRGLPEVRDVDRDAHGPRRGSWQHEGPERQPGTDAEPDGALTLERAGP